MTLTRCPSCRRRGIAKKRIDRTYEVEGALRVVKDILAHVCPHCKGIFLDLEAAEQVDQSLGLGRGRRRRSA